IGTRDKIRTIEFRLALIEKRLRELAAGVPSPAAEPAPEPPPAPAPLATPEPAQPAPEQAAPVPEPIQTAASPPPSSVPPPPPPAPVRSFEERFGTQWVVWAAGIAITIGGFLFLRYSVEQGWFGPGTRVILGALLAILLVAAGEWARWSEKISGITGLPSAN